MAAVYPITNFEDVRVIRRLLTKWGNVREAEAFFINCHMGLRVSDLLQLKFSDFEGTHELRILEKKTENTRKVKKYRTIPITEVMIESVEILRTWYAKKFPFLSPVYLFQGTGNRVKSDVKPVTQKYVRDKIKEACDALGMEHNFATHTMRKTFGYHTYKMTGSLDDIQKIFGHSSQAQTLAYIGVTKETQDNVYKSLDFR